MEELEQQSWLRQTDQAKNICYMSGLLHICVCGVRLSLLISPLFVVRSCCCWIYLCDEEVSTEDHREWIEPKREKDK